MPAQGGHHEHPESGRRTARVDEPGRRRGPRGRRPGHAHLPVQRRRAQGAAGGARRLRAAEPEHQGEPAAHRLGRLPRAVPPRGGGGAGAGRGARGPGRRAQHGAGRRVLQAERPGQAVRPPGRVGRLPVHRAGRPGRRHHPRDPLDGGHLRHGLQPGDPQAGGDREVPGDLGRAQAGQPPDQGEDREGRLGVPGRQRLHQLDLVLLQLLLVVSRLGPGGPDARRKVRDGDHRPPDRRGLRLLQLVLQGRPQRQVDAGGDQLGGPGADRGHGAGELRDHQHARVRPDPDRGGLQGPLSR